MIKFNKPEVRKERTPRFYEAAEKLNAFIKSLPLGQKENDKLVHLMIEQVEAAEESAFNQGVRMGAEFTAYEAGKRQEPDKT